MSDKLEESFKLFLESSESEKQNHDFYNKLRTYILQCATFLLKYQKDYIEDIAQDSFIKIHKQDLSKVKTIKAYVSKVTRHVCYDYFKDNSKVLTDQQENHLDHLTLLPDHLVFEKIETLSLLKEIIEAMTTKCKTLLDMHQYKEISDKELSKYLGLALNQIPQNRLRCLTKLKHYLEKDKKSLLDDLRSVL